MRVWDSTAEIRYLVLPERPAGTDGTERRGAGRPGDARRHDRHRQGGRRHERRARHGRHARLRPGRSPSRTSRVPCAVGGPRARAAPGASAPGGAGTSMPAATASRPCRRPTTCGMSYYEKWLASATKLALAGRPDHAARARDRPSRSGRARRDAAAHRRQGVPVTGGRPDVARTTPSRASRRAAVRTRHQPDRPYATAALRARPAARSSAITARTSSRFEREVRGREAAVPLHGASRRASCGARRPIRPMPSISICGRTISMPLSAWPRSGPAARREGPGVPEPWQAQAFAMAMQLCDAGLSPGRNGWRHCRPCRARARRMTVLPTTRTGSRRWSAFASPRPHRHGALEGRRQAWAEAYRTSAQAWPADPGVAAMSNELWKMTAVEAVTRLKKKEITPLELVEASAQRIAEVEPAVNAHADALPRPRPRSREEDHGRRRSLRSRRRSRLARRPAGLDQGPDRRRRRAHDLRLADLRRPRAGQVPSAGRAHRAQGRHRDGQVQHARVRRRRQHLQRGVRPHAQSLEHLADLRRLDRRRLGLGGDRRGLAGARHRPWRLAAPARHLLLDRRHPPVGRPGDARHVEQSLLAAVGAGADGAQRRRPGAVPRHHGGLLSAGSR